jgi:hypothetical protein
MKSACSLEVAAPPGRHLFFGLLEQVALLDGQVVVLGHCPHRFEQCIPAKRFGQGLFAALDKGIDNTGSTRDEGLYHHVAHLIGVVNSKAQGSHVLGQFGVVRVVRQVGSDIAVKE